MKVIAIDPGPTPGIAVWSNTRQTRDPLRAEGAEFFSTWVGEDRWAAVNVVRDSITEVDAIVVEQFVISGKTAKLAHQEASIVALETIGILRYLCWCSVAENPFVRFVLQKPVDALGFATNAKLKRLGWYTPGPDHARDATRHLVLYLARNGLLPASRLLD